MTLRNLSGKFHYIFIKKSRTCPTKRFGMKTLLFAIFFFTANKLKLISMSMVAIWQSLLVFCANKQKLPHQMLDQNHLI